MQDSQKSISISADTQCYCITNIVLECILEDIHHPGPNTMNVQIFSSEWKTGEALILKKISRLVWKHHGSIELMGDATFCATWDDTGNVGIVNLTKAELKDFTTSTGSDKGVRREILMETDDLVLELRLRFDICRMASGERRVPQIDGDPSVLYPRMAEAERPEEIFRIVLKSSDDMPDKADCLDICGAGFLRSFRGNNNRKEDIDKCILAYESSVHLTPQGHSDMCIRLNKLGESLLLRFDLAGDPTDISKAMLHQQKAIHLCPEGHADMPSWMNNLGASFLSLFKHTGDLANISVAISYQQKAVHLTPESHANMPLWLNNLGVLYRSRFVHSGDLADISDAISYFQKAVHLTPEGHADMLSQMHNLESSFLRRFEHTGDLADISDAISYQQKAVHLTPEGHANMLLSMKNLGFLFQSRFKCTRNLADISDAISYNQKAVCLTPDGHADMPSQLNNLGSSFLHRFEHTGDLADISNAISYQQKAVHLTPEGHADMLIQLNNLGSSFLRRFKHSGDLADISNAISYQQKAVHLTPEGHADMPSHLNNLGASFLYRFEHTGNLADISDAMSHEQRAVHLTPEGHADMPSQLNNLGVSFLNRFETTGDLADISDAISYQQKVVHLTPEGHANMPKWLSNLGNSFGSRFEHSGNLADISDAISYLQKAVHFTPEGHADMPSLLNNLGNSFLTRSRRTGDLADISDAISYHQKAVHLTPEGHVMMSIWLNNLGVSFLYRFQHAGDLADISDAISHEQRAVHLTPEGHAEMPTRLNNLGISFLSRFQHTEDLADISDAISYQKKAVHLTPEGRATLPTRLNNLGNSFRSRFKHTGDLADISDSISYQQKAVHFTPEGHADMPIWLYNLGSSFEIRFNHTKDLADIHILLSIDRQSATCSSGSPSTRLMAAIRWAQHSSYDLPQSLEAYNTAIQLISQVGGLEQTIQKRHTNLLDISDLVTSATACAFKFRRPELALEWLEQGRCLIWNQLNNLRSPLDTLFAYDEQIAHDMLRVSRALENAGSRGDLVTPFQDKATMEQKMSIQDESNTHIKLAQEWNELLTKIRTIPKFEDFLQPSSCSKLLKNLPDSGPVVVINVHKDSCDALALLLDLEEPLHIPLHKFSYAKASSLRNQLNAHLRAANVRMRECEVDGIRGTHSVRDNDSGGVIKHILYQLWILVVKPILNGLGFSEEPPSKLPRIWWCATGPLAFLPIHAAGIYATSVTRVGSTLSNFAVSSYIPNVRALTERVLNSPQILNKRKTAFFMISQPETPNLPHIPGTTKEVLAIMETLKKHNVQFLCLKGEVATVKQGITYMETHSCIHFACHAHQNTKEPLKSSFMLHDGGLELSEIIKKKLEGADLAYLSACQTSTGDEKLSEEAVHLAAGMLAAGYRSVVATMWSISDQHGPQVAEDFYTELISQDLELEQLSNLSTDNAARALHYSTQKLRKQLGDSALDWIPYVHFGL